MSTFRNVLMVTLAAASLALFAGCASEPEQSSEFAASTPRGDWTRELSETVADELCGQGEMFRNCFQISDSTCHEQARAVTTSCEAQYSPYIPPKLNESQMVAWGGRIGECAGVGLYQALQTVYPLDEDAQACQNVLDQL